MNYCLFNPKGEPLSFKFQADQPLVIGADFKIFSEDKKILIDEWKVSLEKGQPLIRQCKISPERLGRTIVVWQILCCSTDVNVSEGYFYIEIKQEGKNCSTTQPLKSSLSNIAPCSLNVPVKTNGAFMLFPKS